MRISTIPIIARCVLPIEHPGSDAATESSGTAMDRAGGSGLLYVSAIRCCEPGNAVRQSAPTLGEAAEPATHRARGDLYAGECGRTGRGSLGCATTTSR